MKFLLILLFQAGLESGAQNDVAELRNDAESRWTKTAAAPVVTVFDLGTAAEAIYQPVFGQRLVTSQLWVGDKDAEKNCPVPITTKA